MPTRWNTFPIKFEGGLITTLGRLEQGIQAPGSATILQNYEPSITGGYRRILGYTKFSDTEVTGTGTVTGVVSVDGTDVIARRGDVYYLSSGTTWASKATVATTGSLRVMHDYYNFDGDDKIVMVDGYNDPAFYDATADTVTFDTSAPSDVTGASLVKVFKNQLFFAKDTLLSFTAPYTDDDYTPANGAGTINLGNTITGLIVFREELIIFTNNSIHRLTGSTLVDFALQPIANNTGCLCPYTIQEVGGDIMYLGPDGIRYLSATEKNNDFALERASYNIQNKITNLITSNCAYSSIVIRGKNQYRIFVYSEATPAGDSDGYIATRFSDQSVNNIAWATTLGIKVYVSDSRQFQNKEVIYFANDDGYVYQMESGNDFDGGNIEAIFETPYMPLNDPRIRKTIFKHSLYLNTTGNFNITVNLKFDYNPGGSIQPPSFTLSSSGGTAIYGEATYGAATYSAQISDTFVNQTVGSGFVVNLRYEGENMDAPYSLNHAILEFMDNERR